MRAQNAMPSAQLDEKLVMFTCCRQKNKNGRNVTQYETDADNM